MNFFLLHPSDAALDDFAAGNPARADHRRVVSHLEVCQKCRNQVAFRRQLRAEARGLTSPEPSPDLLDRVLRDRAAGERIILPIARRRAPAPYREIARIAVAVAVIAGVGLIVRYARTSSSTDIPLSRRAVAASSDQPDSLSGLRELFTSTVFLPGIASAEEPTTSGEVLQPVGPQIDGTRMREGEASYQRRYIDASGKRTMAGKGVVSLRSTTLGGSPVWRFERKWTEYARNLPGSRETQENEVMILGQRDLKVIQRDIHAFPYGSYSRITVAQRFNGDSIYGRMMSEGGDSKGVGRTFLRRLPSASGPFISDAFAPLFFGSIRVTPSWHGRLSILGWAVRDSDVFHPIELRVAGRERVTVPAGTFECWHFIMTSGTRRFDFWSRVSDGLGVLARNETDRSTLGVSELVLTHASP